MIIKVETDNKSWVQFGIDFVEDAKQRRYLSISWKEGNDKGSIAASTMTGTLAIAIKLRDELNELIEKIKENPLMNLPDETVANKKQESEELDMHPDAVYGRQYVENNNPWHSC